jgi:hypothetical protein
MTATVVKVHLADHVDVVGGLWDSYAKSFAERLSLTPHLC